MTKKLFCRCNAVRLNKDVSWPWHKARMFGAIAIDVQCPQCGLWKWRFPSALAVKKWYNEVRQNPYLLKEVVK
jgi:hypothetical protein